MKKITNGTIEVNGTQCVLLDDRAKEGIFVDREDLGEPTWQFEPLDEDYFEWRDTSERTALRIRDSKDFDKPRIRQVVRFKHPDRMEVLEEINVNGQWIPLAQDKTSKLYAYEYGETRQRFILKEKEQEAFKKRTKPPINPNEIIPETLLKKMGIMNSDGVIDEEKVAALPTNSGGKNPYQLIIETGLEGDYIKQDDVVSLMELYRNQPSTLSEYNKLKCEACLDALRKLNDAVGEEDRWIKVGDRLPETDTLSNVSIDVMFRFQSGRIKIGHYADAKCFLNPNHFSDNEGVYSVDNITHWMPLPNPPKQ